MRGYTVLGSDGGSRSDMEGVRAVDNAIARENARYLAIPVAERQAAAQDHANSTWGVLICSWLMPVQWTEHVSKARAEVVDR